MGALPSRMRSGMLSVLVGSIEFNGFKSKILLITPLSWAGDNPVAVKKVKQKVNKSLQKVHWIDSVSTQGTKVSDLGKGRLVCSSQLPVRTDENLFLIHNVSHFCNLINIKLWILHFFSHSLDNLLQKTFIPGS